MNGKMLGRMCYRGVWCDCSHPHRTHKRQRVIEERHWRKEWAL